MKKGDGSKERLPVGRKVTAAKTQTAGEKSWVQVIKNAALGVKTQV